MRTDDDSGERPASDASTHHVETVVSLHAKTERALDDHQRFVERVVARIGRPRTIYLLITAVLVWAVVNEAMPQVFGRPSLDEPPFFWLQGFLALYAALVTTMVLTVQNRAQRASQQRSYLELQVNLMAEEKTTKLIALLEELRRDLPNVKNRVDKEAELMSRTVDAHAVLSALEESIQEESEAPRSDSVAPPTPFP